jgi:1-acyl-sn-glycerol-3-phosphate acyltransferase
VNVTAIGRADIAKWDPGLTQRLMSILRPLAKQWHRSEVRGLELMPPGGSLVVSNHSGGVIAMDVPVFAIDFYEQFGYDRPVYTLTHDILFRTPAAELVMRAGFIPATRDNASTALRAGAVVMVFPGGPDDAYRPTAQANTIDFHGRTGYVKTALAAGVPIVPVVSIGGQESQLFLSRGTWLAHLLRLDKRARITILPLSFGFPFGLSIGPTLNLPMPTKIVTQVLHPIDIVAQFGEDPDPVDVDNHVRSVMQNALDELAATRRFPILG